MGWKKACDVRDGTWLLLAALGGLPVDPEMLLFKLALWRPIRCGCPPRDEENPVLAVPGRESEAMPLRLWGFALLGWNCSLPNSSPSSEAMSVIREDIILGGLAGYRGFESSSPSLGGVDRLSGSFAAMVVGSGMEVWYRWDLATAEG